MAALLTFATHQLAIVMFKDELLNTEPKFYAAAVHNVLVVFISCAIDNSLMYLPVGFMCYIVAMVNQLVKRMEVIASDSELTDAYCVERENRYMKELISCIQTHVKIRSLTQDIGDNFSTILLVQGLMSSIILCTIIYFLSLVS